MMRRLHEAGDKPPTYGLVPFSGATFLERVMNSDRVRLEGSRGNRAANELDFAADVDGADGHGPAHAIRSYLVRPPMTTLEPAAAGPPSS